jgi:proline iminopeptidase
MARLELPHRRLHLEYEVHGPQDGTAVLLIMGLGMQLLAWPQPYVEALTTAGYRVVTFDNRDAGLSGSGELAPHMSMRRALLCALFGRPVRPAYTLHDMADDTLALADALSISRFHVAGISMGGMISQILATRAPERVLSLTSIMSSAGNNTAPRPAPSVLMKSLRRPPQGAEPEQLERHFFELFKLIGALGEDEFELAPLRERLARTVRRAYNPAGTTRQLLAIMASADRSREVRRIAVPTLIIHGRQDPLVRIGAAERLAKLIPHARLEIIDGMGHYLPLRHIERLAQLCLAHFQRATR